MSPDAGMTGSVVAVTGGASGLGEATARLVVERGGAVVVADIQDDRGAALVEGLGDAAAYVHTDVTSEQQVAAAIDTAVERFGRLDCMFNNAGIVGATGPIEELSLDDFDVTIAVLLRSVAIGMKHAARVMVPAGRGVILSTSSVAGVLGGLGPHSYAAAKAGLIGLTRNVAAELGQHGIRVNAIVPGSMATPMVADVRTGDPSAIEATRVQLAEESPLAGRGGVAEDIAHAAVWLMSDEAGFVSGHALVVDGGLTSGGIAVRSGQGSRLVATSGMVREAGKRGGEV